MRKIPVLFLFGFFFCAFLNAPHLLDAQSLDEAIIAAAVKISRELPENVKAAIISFKSPTEALTKYVIDELNGNILRNRRVTPVVPDQNQLQRIQSELRFNITGEVEMESAKNIGRMLEVAYVITGSLERYIGSEYKIFFNVYDTENAKLQSQYTALLNLRNDPHLSVLLGSAAQHVYANFLDGDSWKNKSVYLGGGLGFGNYTYTDYYNDHINEETEIVEDNFFFVSLISDFVISNFFTIGVIANYGIPFFPSLSLMAKFGGKIGLVELTGNLGYALVPLGFTIGGTFGIKAGNGIIFIDISAVPLGIFIEDEFVLDRTGSAFRAMIGYKIGVGKDRN